MGLPMVSSHKTEGLGMRLVAKVKKEGKDLWQQLNRDNLHFRILRCVIATAATVIIALLPGIKPIYGPAAYLGPMTTVLGHPGMRLGGMIEALVLGLIGISVGIAWTILGTYLGSLCYETNPTATMGIRAIFLIVATLIHGYIRSIAPRLFMMVLLMALPVVLGVTSTTFYITSSFVTMLFYPMITAVAILLIVNIFIFPEFGATGLGLTTVETLQKTIFTLNDAIDLFVESCGQPAPDTLAHHHYHRHRFQNSDKKKVVRLAELTGSKPSLRAKVAECKSVYRDCAFDISYSCLAPKELKPITSGINRLVMNVMALVGACESKFALMGTAEYSVGEEEPPQRGSEQAKGNSRESKNDETEKENEKISPKEEKKGYVPGLKVQRAIENGDQQVLKYLLNRVAVPINTLQDNIDRSFDVISTCVAIVYGVPRLPSLKQGPGPVRHPAGVLLQELDIYIDCLSEAITAFAESSANALEGAAELQEHHDRHEEVDIMPRDEVFLISSFLLNLRLAATQTLDMLKHSRVLVEARMERNGKRGFHWPDVGLQRWLSTSSEETEAPSAAEPLRSQEDDDDDDDSQTWRDALAEPGSRDWTTVAKARETESRINREKKKKIAMVELEKANKPFSLKLREAMADFIDWIKTSDHVLYAFKFTFGVLLVTWPAFIHDWTLWYENARAVWVAIIFILMFENAVGSTVWMIFLRAAGTVLGSTLGYAAYESDNGNTITMGAILLILLIPAYYVQLGTKYQKAGMIFTVSMCVVSLSTHLQTVPGSSFENFYKRTVASLISGCVALLVHITLFPVKARTKLKDCLATAIFQINLMESCVALGVDEKQTHMIRHPRFLKRFERAAKKAGAALSSAEAFLNFARHEPRVKGKWEPHALIYKEIIFVLRQIVERMENLLRLRIAYGSAVLEEFNARVHGYRRNVAAAITLTLYAVQQSLTQKLPLPQFLPSARLANLRMVVRVRQILHEEFTSAPNTPHRSRSGSINDESASEADKDNEITAVKVQTPPASRVHVEGSSTSGPISNRRRLLRLRILSWNAASAALEECVEYVEELVDLAKLLVGVNEFRSGLLHRPTFREYLGDIYSETSVKGESGIGGTTEGTVGTGTVRGMRVGHTRGAESRAEDTSTMEIPTTSLNLDDALDDENRDAVNSMHRTVSREPTLPHPLARIQSRREAERMKRKHE